MPKEKLGTKQKGKIKTFFKRIKERYDAPKQIRDLLVEVEEGRVSKPELTRIQVNFLGKKLLTAAKNGDIKTAKNCLSLWPNLIYTATTITMMSPLMLAAKNGHLDMCKLLTEHFEGKDELEINWIDNRGYTALMLAAKKNYREIVEYLLSQGADPSVKAHRLSVSVMAYRFREQEPLGTAKKAGDLTTDKYIKKLLRDNAEYWEMYGKRLVVPLVKRIGVNGMISFFESIRECSPDAVKNIFENL